MNHLMLKMPTHRVYKTDTPETPLIVYRMFWDTDKDGYPRERRKQLGKCSDLKTALAIIYNDL